jgi:hypothetical protein
VSLAGVIALCLLSTTALAQRGGGPQLSPEKREAAWTLEAKGVAKTAGVSAENTDKVVKAYIASRKHLTEAMEKMAAGGGGGGGGMREEMQKMNDTERGELTKALTEALPKDQVDKVAGPLGTFYRGWDRLVDALAGLKLDADKQDKGLALLATFAVESDKAMRAGAGAGDRQAMMTAMQERKSKLDAELAKELSLNEEQTSKWKEATAFGGGGGGGGRRNGGSGGGAPAGGGAAAPAPAPAAK